MSTFRSLPVLALSAGLAACSAADHPLPPTMDGGGPEVAAAGRPGDVPVTTAPRLERFIETELTELARRLEADVQDRRSGVAARGVWWTGHPESGAVGGEVIFDDRGDKRMGIEWVAGDPRRNGRTDIGYAFGHPAFPHAPAGLTPGDVEAAVDRGMATWDEPSCSTGLTISKGSFQDWLAADSDILHAGFDGLPEGVLGVTLPFFFVDPSTGEPTDIDRDGHADYAFAVILYTDAFPLPWAIDGNIDVESVALHEAGHGLGQDHFGTLFQTLANGRFHFAPLSVMNAGYTGVQQVLTGTDEAGHCGLYGSWPVG